MAPDPIKRFVGAQPGWLETRSVTVPDPTLHLLDAGERDTISIALAASADLVRLHEKKGRQAARQHGLAVSGTLGVLELAASRGLVRMLDAIETTPKGAMSGNANKSGNSV